MRKPFIALTVVVLVITAQFIATSPARRSLRAQLNPNYLRAMAAYKRLEPKLPRQELHAITTIGILNGAKEAEHQMEAHLIDTLKELLLNADVQNRDKVVPKIDQIERQLTRDQRALEILTSAMDLVMNRKNVKDYKREMQVELQKIRRQPAGEVQIADEIAADEKQTEDNVSARVAALRQNMLKQVNTMKSMVAEKIEHTLDYLIDRAEADGVLAKASNKVVRKRDTSDSEEQPAEVRMINSILTADDFRDNLIEDGFEKRKDEDLDSLEDDFELDGDSKKVIANQTSISRSTASSNSSSSTSTTTEISKPAKQEAGSAENDDGPDGGAGGGAAGGGGLVGIITSLSGGEGGSDIGALLGALTGLVSTLFGPGGLDVESLIATGTSLIAGLLAGDKNFGTVLGQYVGTAFDGLSGGGGAINNGQFIGNFLGTVLASLSADPEDDDEPPKPLLFVQNLVSSFFEAKNRKGSGEASTEERKGHNNKKEESFAGWIDSGGFIKQIASHLAGSAISLLLNAAVGASGGASHASSALLASGSSKGDGGGGGHAKSWQ